MVRTQRLIVVPVVSMVLLLAAMLGMWLGSVPQHEWELWLVRAQGGQLASVTTSPPAQTTLYVIDDRPTTVQSVVVDLDSLAAYAGGMHMPVKDGLVLHLELLPESLAQDLIVAESPAMISARAAHP
ncbi:MAG: hypothetical protein ACOYZ7_09720 [Chloroflexota bacterium]